jgi:hypothetical protein
MSNPPSLAIKLFGTEEPVAPLRTLRAGPLTVELDGGNLRYIRINGIEAIRGIAFLARDKDWGTYCPKVTNFAVEEKPDCFSVRYDAICQDAQQELRYSAHIVGQSDGTLRFEAVATAASDFLTARTGFVVLHPIADLAGQPLEVLHVDGSRERSAFPELIEPWQPFKDLRALTHEVLPGVKLTCTLAGDTYEMEDQRNWMDASYKTYVRPLALPWPFTLKAGERLQQSVTLMIEGALAPATAPDREPVRIRVGGAAGVLPGIAMPDINLGLEPQHAAAALAAIDLIKRLGPQHITCWFDPRAGHGLEELKRYKAIGTAVSAELVLEAVVPCVEDYRVEISRIAEQAVQAGVRFAAVSVCPAPYLKSVTPGAQWPKVPPLEAIYTAARAAFPGVLLGGGMLTYFTELNRQRPPLAPIDYITHTLTATVHASDDISVTENLETLPYIIRSTRAIGGDKPYRIGPSAIGMRSNPYGARVMDNRDNGRTTMTRLDPRQRGLLGAAWNVGLVAHLARGGIESVALSAPVGEFGLIYQPMPWPQPWFDEAKPAVYPAYHVVGGMAAAAGATRLETVSSASRDVECIAYRKDDTTTLWIANLTGEERQVDIQGLAAGEAIIQMLDAATFEQCVKSPEGFAETARRISPHTLILAPYAVTRIEALDPL